MPCVKMGEQQIKSILENEFSIDDEVTVSYGGRSIKRNARLSFRYFLMYNTLSKDVVDNGKLFFDKLNIERYRDVWFQIFDLSLGVIDLNTITFQKKIEELRQSIFILEAEKKKENRKKQQVESQVDLLIKHAKENKLIDESLQREEAFSKIREMISEGAICFSSDFSVQQKFVELQEKREKTPIFSLKALWQSNYLTLCLQSLSLFDLIYIEYSLA